MERLKLPIGIQDFRTLREEGFYYVDKTSHIKQLIDKGRYYFLSRPRRFGKSLLVDTLRQLFEGYENLFQGLAIHDQWDWSVKYPVVRLSFDGVYNQIEEIDGDIIEQLEAIERHHQLEPALASNTAPRRLRNILDRLHRKSGRQVVVLVDEYDKPILDVIDKPQLAEANRDYLKSFYGIIKGSARDVRFVFVTGVSMFSKVSLFSGLNNLENISLDPDYATICGYTEQDLDEVFSDELSGLDRNQVQQWYNGYHWLGDKKVYNPFGFLLLLRKRQFESHWFETGSPTFLFKMMMQQEVTPLELESRIAAKKLISNFDIDNIAIDALLFQTGYLTITNSERHNAHTLYTLDYPNLEVRQSLSQEFLNYLGCQDKQLSDQGWELGRLLKANDFAGFMDCLKAFFAGLPYQWQSTDDQSRYEVWYAGMLYACFQTVGFDIRVEEASLRGRADMIVLYDDQVFIFEFKMATDSDGARTAEEAIQQIKDRGYADKYKNRQQPVHLIGIAFGQDSRNISDFKVVTA